MEVKSFDSAWDCGGVNRAIIKWLLQFFYEKEIFRGLKIEFEIILAIGLERQDGSYG